MPRFPFDEYEMKAQLLPALVVSFPAVGFVYGVLPAMRNFWTGIGGTVLELAALYVLMRIGRDRGAKLQARLYERWGGKPSTAMLRYQDQTVDRFTKSRYKNALAKMCGLEFPTEAEEGVNPRRADEVYESAIRALLERRRGKTFPLIFRENCNYGFVRNLVGLKSIGLVVVIGTLLADNIVLWFHLADPKGIAVSAFISVATGLVLFMLSPASVKRTGEAYAVALLRSCEPGNE
jgi:hypothetical protein